MAKVKGPKRIWDNCVNVGEIQNTARTKFKVDVTTRDGVKYLNIREWYLKQSTSEWKPGMAGFAVPIKYPIDGKLHTPAGDLMALMLDAIKKSDGVALEDEVNAVYTKE